VASSSLGWTGMLMVLGWELVGWFDVVGVCVYCSENVYRSTVGIM
jgi:hypothetical protein